MRSRRNVSGATRCGSSVHIGSQEEVKMEVSCIYYSLHVLAALVELNI